MLLKQIQTLLIFIYCEGLPMQKKGILNMPHLT